MAGPKPIFLIYKILEYSGPLLSLGSQPIGNSAITLLVPLLNRRHLAYLPAIHIQQNVYKLICPAFNFIDSPFGLIYNTIV